MTDKCTPSESPSAYLRRRAPELRSSGAGSQANAYEVAADELEDLRGQPKTGGELTYEEMVAACKNVGLDLSCGECASIFYTGTGGYTHTCALKDAAPLVIAVGEPTEHLKKP